MNLRTRRQLHNPKGNQGFSLIEVLICVCLLALISIPVLRSFRSAAVMNSKAYKTQAATEEAQNIVEAFTRNSLSLLQSIYSDGTVSGGEYHTYWPTLTFNPLTDCGSAPEECYEVLTFLQRGMVSDSGRVYDCEIILDPSTYSEAATLNGSVSNLNTLTLPVVEDIDAVTNAVISTELSRYDLAASADLQDTVGEKNVVVTLENSSLDSLKVTATVTYVAESSSKSVSYVVYQNSFLPILNEDGTDYESGGDIYLFTSAFTVGRDTVTIVNNYVGDGSSLPNLDVHFIRGGQENDANFKAIFLSDGVATTVYMDITGSSAEKIPAGNACVYGMDFTSNVKYGVDSDGDPIPETSTLTRIDTRQYEQTEAARLRCYLITVRLYSEGTFDAYEETNGTIGTTGTLSDSLYNAVKDRRVCEVVSTINAE